MPNFVFFVFLPLALSIVSCSGLRTSKTPSYELASEVSLKEDKKQLDEVRAEIPEEVRKENDELKEILQRTGALQLPPNVVRERFQTKSRRKRQAFQDSMRKVRDKFRKVNDAKRKEFLAEQKKSREDFKSRKHEREETTEFYKDQDLKRKDFYAEQSDERKEFEARMSEQQKDFNFEVKQDQKSFSEEMKQYTRRYNEYEKQKRDLQKNTKIIQQQNKSTQRVQSQKNSQSGSVLKEFEEMKNVPGTPLGADGE